MKVAASSGHCSVTAGVGTHGSEQLIVTLSPEADLHRVFGTLHTLVAGEILRIVSTCALHFKAGYDCLHHFDLQLIGSVVHLILESTAVIVELPPKTP